METVIHPGVIARVPFLLVLDKKLELTKHEAVAAMAISTPDEVGFTVEQVSLRTMIKFALSLCYQYGFILEYIQNGMYMTWYILLFFSWSDRRYIMYKLTMLCSLLDCVSKSSIRAARARDHVQERKSCRRIAS